MRITLTNHQAHRIDAIKLVRQFTGYGLKEAKTLCDRSWGRRENDPIILGNANLDRQRVYQFLSGNVTFSHRGVTVEVSDIDSGDIVAMCVPAVVAARWRKTGKLVL